MVCVFIVKRAPLFKQARYRSVNVLNLNFVPKNSIQAWKTNFSIILESMKEINLKQTCLYHYYIRNDEIKEKIIIFSFILTANIRIHVHHLFAFEIFAYFIQLKRYFNLPLNSLCINTYVYSGLYEIKTKQMFLFPFVSSMPLMMFITSRNIQTQR